MLSKPMTKAECEEKYGAPVVVVGRNFFSFVPMTPEEIKEAEEYYDVIEEVEGNLD